MAKSKASAVPQPAGRRTREPPNGPVRRPREALRRSGQLHSI